MCVCVLRSSDSAGDGANGPNATKTPSQLSHGIRVLNKRQYKQTVGELIESATQQRREKILVFITSKTVTIDTLRRMADKKPRGRTTSYAYFVQQTREDFKKSCPDENVAFAEFSKKCSEQWKGMGDSAKKKFVRLADRDKKRYESEMKTYIPPKETKAKGKKSTKDKNAPKRPLSAFFWFCNDERESARESITKPGEKVSVGDVAKELGRRWKSIDPSAKTKYESLAAKDKARYEAEVAAYKSGGPIQSDETSDSDD